MDYFSNPENLKYIQNLFSPPEEDWSETEIDDRVPGSSQITQAPHSSSEIQNQNATEPSSSGYSGINRKSIAEIAISQPTTLAEWEENEKLLFETEIENRKAPEYRIIYKQSVSPEDIYLGIGNKTPATASCEEMCLEIILPEETVNIDRMQLDVNTNEIDLLTPIYRLKLPLVQRIDPDRSKAQWDDEQKILRLILRMKREYDFINF